MVACTFHIAQLVKKRHDPNSCTKELLFKTFSEINSDADVQRFYRSMLEEKEEDTNH